MAGLTENGFEVKSFGEIKLELENSFKTIFGENINLDSTSLLGQTIGVFTKQLFDLWQLGSATYQSRYPHSSTGINLEKVVDIAGLKRIRGFKTSGSVFLIGEENVSVPAGTTLATSSTIKVQTQEQAVLELGVKPIIRFFRQDANLSTTFTIDIRNSLFGIYEDILGKSTRIIWEDSIEDIKTKLEVVFGDDSIGLVEKSVSGTVTNSITVNFESRNFTPIIDIIGADKSIVTAGFPTGKAVGCEALEDGNVVIKSGQVKIIDTPVDDLESVLNVKDFITGRLEETDRELRQRWFKRVETTLSSSKGSIESALLNITGVSLAIVSEGTGTIECIINGGEDQELAKAIYNTKPAGVGLVGSTETFIDDDNGNKKLVRFSRPTIKNLIVKVQYRKTDEFESDGETQIRTALNDYQRTKEIGSSISVTPDIVWALNGIRGLDRLFISIGTLESNLSSFNVQLAPREVLAFSNIIIEEVV